jgi:hypothetical protein
VKIGLAAIAGVGAAWLIPKGGTAPAPSTTPTPTPPGQLTAAEFPLSTIPPGVSFKTIDGVRVFLVRTGSTVVAFHGVSTDDPGPVYWCPKNDWFEGLGPGPYYDRAGKVLRYEAPRDLDMLSVIVAGGRVTVFPHRILPGTKATIPATPVPLPAPPPPCSAAQRVG